MQRFGDFFGENHDSLINQHLKKVLYLLAL